MNRLKTTLISIYAVLILLLLLSWCSRPQHKPAERTSEETIAEDPDLPPVTERFSADVVMCIDATGSMGGIINTVKNNAMNFYDDIKKESRRHGKDITSMRIRVIAYRDIHMLMSGNVFDFSDFFSMPDEENEFKSFVGGLTPHDGGDEPELGLDALAMAMTESKWSGSGNTKKVIILWTDADTKMIQRTSAHMIKDTQQLLDEWNGKFAEHGKMFLFTPNATMWNDVARSLENAVRHDVTAGGGLSDLDYKEILETISEDI